jgi:hypothetical protein
LKGKSVRVIRAIIMLYLVVSGICFEEVRTERFFCPSFLYQSNATTNSIPILTDLLGSAREDACTAEMLGSTSNVFSCQQEAPKIRIFQRKPETLRWISVALAAFLLPFSSYVSFLISKPGCAGNLTEIIQFIHSKDGKK